MADTKAQSDSWVSREDVDKLVNEALARQATDIANAARGGLHDHTAGVGQDVAPTWSLAEQEAARRGELS